MHIPDGWLSLPVIGITWSITLIALGLSISRFKQHDLEKLSNIGAMASVVFVAQMFNFPIAGGTSGHLLGSALSVYVVGLPGAILTLFTVLLVQATIFGDGGILALGANMFNMGIVGAVVAYLIINRFSQFKSRENKRLYFAGVFLSCFFAVTLASLFAGLELVASGRVDWQSSIPIILFWHVLIGIGEGILSIFIISYLLQTDFPLSDRGETAEITLFEAFKKSNKPLMGLSSLLFILSLIALFASSSPDGLSSAGIELGLPDGTSINSGIGYQYEPFGISGVVGTLLSALLGIVIISGLLFLPAFYIRERKMQSTTAA